MELIDDYVYELFDLLEGYLRGDAAFFLYDAQAIAAIASLCYLAVKGYMYMSGDEKWEIMPLLRPFALGLCIIFWMEFVTVLEYPFEIFEARTEGLYDNTNDEIDLLLLEKNKLTTEMAREISEIAEDVESVSAEDNDSIFGDFSIDLSGIVDEAKSLYLIIMAKFRLLMEQIIQFIVLGFFQGCNYLVHFLQVFFKHILIVLGPIAFALSIFGGFKDSYITWIGRFISVALYSTIARIVLVISLTFVKYALEFEIQVLERLMSDENAFILYVTGSGNIQTAFVVSLFVGAIALLTVPVVSTWIVNTSGVGQAVGKMAKGGVSAATAPMKVI